jgi:hypothetical protein
VADEGAAAVAGSQVIADWATARPGDPIVVSDSIAMSAVSRSPRIHDDDRIPAVSSLQLASQSLTIDAESIEWPADGVKHPQA